MKRMTMIHKRMLRLVIIVTLLHVVVVRMIVQDVVSTSTTTKTRIRPRAQYFQQQLQLAIAQQQQQKSSDNDDDSNIMKEYHIIVHPNGNVHCSYRIVVPVPSPWDIQNSVTTTDHFEDPSSHYTISTKYQIEATMTEYIVSNRMNIMSSSPTFENDERCWDSPQQQQHKQKHQDIDSIHDDATAITNLFYHYCDRGAEYTVIQRDYDQLIRVGGGDSDSSSSSNSQDIPTYLPCRFYTREGIRITSIQDIVSKSNTTSTISDMATAASSTSATTSTTATVDMDGLTETTTTIPSPNNDDNNITTTAIVVEYHLYAVPAGRVFMFAPKYINETFHLHHIDVPTTKAPSSKQTNDDDDLLSLLSLHENNQYSTNTNNDTKAIISLQVLNLEPPIYEITNLFTQQETYDLLRKAVQEQDKTYKFHRSTTGTSSSSIYSKRTSENAWDTHGKTAQIIKRRCFELLGFDEYDEEMTDGLQILRYNLTTAYISHLDYLEDRSKTEEYDYDTSHTGGNRFATIILYFTTIQEGAGGETVFPHIYPPNIAIKDRISDADALHALRNHPETKGVLKQGSWEEQMTVQCRTRFAVRPQALRAILFYSQYPNGTLDPLSYHGGCPVLNGTKLAANMWTWSAIRPEFDGGPIRESVRKHRAVTSGTDDKQQDDDVVVDDTSEVEPIHVTFQNRRIDERYRHAELYYGSLSSSDTDDEEEDVFFSQLDFDHDQMAVNTYVGHTWYIKDATTKEVLQTFTITAELYEKENVSFEV